MKKMKKFLASSWVTTVAFVLAAGLLLFSSVGGARAALTYYSETYSSRVQMYDIGVTLVENGRDVSWRNYSSASDGTWDEGNGILLENALEKDKDGNPREHWKVGKAYPEELKVRNSGTINQYVRVSIYKYWLDAKGNKLQGLSPDLIDLNLVNLGTDWLLDEAASTPERTVLYYNKLLYADNTGKTETVPLSDTITIDGMVATKVNQTVSKDGPYTVITTTYDYDGAQFQIEASVDAVQEHNAQDAIWSAWGRRVTIENKTLRLN